jgi:hypothetical protein
MAHPVRVQERLRGWRCRGLMFGGRPCEDSMVSWREAVRGYSSWRGGVPSSHASTASGMVMQWPGWRWGRRGWPHRADGDGGDRAHRPDITALSLHGRGVVVRLPFEGSAILFRGCGASAVQGCCWPRRTVLHSGGDGLARGVGGAVPGRDSQARSGVDSPLTWTSANVSSLNAPAEGAGV